MTIFLTVAQHTWCTMWK